jgi:hypothetical protein
VCSKGFSLVTNENDNCSLPILQPNLINAFAATLPLLIRENKKPHQMLTGLSLVNMKMKTTTNLLSTSVLD